MGVDRDVGLYRIGCGAALITGPALFLVDNLIHPEELGRGNEAAQLGLAYVVRRPRPRLGLAAGAAGVAGLMGLSFAFALDGFTWGVLGEISARPGADPATAALALHEVQQSAWSAPYYALTALWGAALVALAWGAARAGVLRAAPAVLLALGTIAVGLEGVVQDNTYFIASSALLLLGGAWAGFAILRLDDTAFAAGRGA